MMIRRVIAIVGCAVVGLWMAGCNCPCSSQKKAPAATNASKPAEAPKAVEAPKPVQSPKPAEAPKALEAPKAPGTPKAADATKKFVLRVDCGASAPFTDKLGNVWAADQELGGGMAWGADDGMTVDREGVGITGTDIPRIYETERYSMGSYKFTVPNGKYTVRLHCAETYDGITAPGQRVFSVSIGGQVVLKDVDLFKEVGALKPLVREFKGVSVENGQLVIGFTPNIENPQICGIEILAE